MGMKSFDSKIHQKFGEFSKFLKLQNSSAPALSYGNAVEIDLLSHRVQEIFDAEPGSTPQY